MNSLYIERTRLTPEVILSSKKRVLQIKGRSSPENALQFYQQIQNAIDEFFEENNALYIRFIFEYFNTSSSKCIFEILKKLKAYKIKGRKMKIDWVYETDDDDMFETGEDFADIVGIKINFKEVESISEIAA